MDNSVAHARRTRIAELTIEHLASCEAELREENAMLVNRVDDLERERDSYRELLQAALAQLARSTAHLDAARGELSTSRWRDRQRSQDEARRVA
jgi:hypothetical protein